MNPSFSPDGARVACESDRSGVPERWACDPDGSNLVKLTSYNGPLTGTPRWSPDGKSIAFDSRAAGLSGLYVISADGGSALPIATGIPNSEAPAWSSTGDWLYFFGKRDGVPQLWKLRRAGGAVVSIAREAGGAVEESIDGGRVYYAKGRTEWALWSALVDGRDARPVEGMPALRMQWSGTWAVADAGVYFLNGDAPHPGIDLFDPSSRQVRRVLDVGRPQPWDLLAVARDGRSLLYTQVERLASDIMLLENFR